MKNIVHLMITDSVKKDCPSLTAYAVKFGEKVGEDTYEFEGPAATIALPRGIKNTEQLWQYCVDNNVKVTDVIKDPGEGCLI